MEIKYYEIIKNSIKQINSILKKDNIELKTPCFSTRDAKIYIYIFAKKSYMSIDVHGSLFRARHESKAKEIAAKIEEAAIQLLKQNQKPVNIPDRYIDGFLLGFEDRLQLFDNIVGCIYYLIKSGKFYQMRSWLTESYTSPDGASRGGCKTTRYCECEKIIQRYLFKKNRTNPNLNLAIQEYKKYKK